MTDAAGPPAPPRGLKPWQKKLTWVGVAAVAVGAAYLTGRLQTAGKIDSAEEQAQSFKSESEKHLATVKAERAALARLEARRALHLMLLELDARNFGIAKQHQEEAAALLRRATDGAPPELAKLADEVAKFPVRATENLTEQRSTVLDWVKRFDTLIPPQK